MKNLILIFTILFSSPLYPQNAQSIITAKGDIDCGYFLSSCDINLLHLDCQAQTSRAEGIITGMNVANYGGKAHVGKDVSHDTIKHSLIKYCRDNPLDSTTAATIDIYKKLFPKAPK